MSREDDPNLAKIERRAQKEIQEALAQQLAELEAEANELGGQNIEAIVGRMMEKVKEKGDFREAVFRLVYRSVAAGMVSAPFDLPEVALEQDVDWGMMDSNAYSFAETYTYDLVTGINQTTERGLRNALTRWIEEGGTLDDLVESIRPVFANEAATRRIENLFKVDRARMIAVTEATRAYVQGTVQYWVAQGFAMPREAPPKHVNCRCDIGIKKDEFGNYWWVWFTAKDEHVCPLCNPYILNPQISIAKAAAPKEEEIVIPAEPNQLSQELLDVLLEEEDSLRNLKTHELGYIFSPDGRLLLHRKGSEHQILFTKEEVVNVFRGNIFTHNHPKSLNFSDEDLHLAMMSGLAEMRAVGKYNGIAYTYRFRPGEKTVAWASRNGMDATWKEIRKVHGQVWHQVRASLPPPLPREEEIRVSNIIMQEIVKTFNEQEGLDMFYEMEVE